MTTYSVTCTVQGLEPLHVALLEQAGCHVTDDRVSYDISLQTEETDNEFTERSKRWINRELSRVNALTERFFEATAFEFEPRIGNITVRPAAAWGYVPQKPPSHNGWEDEGLEFRLNAWNVASKTEDVVLRFVMLDTICESTEVNQDWADRDKWPPRFAEVRLVRNLLVHGKEEARGEVLQYLQLCTRDIQGNRFTNRHKHLELARLRAPFLSLAVWRVIIDGCVDTEVDLYADDPAPIRGIFTIDEGPYPIVNQNKNS